MKCEIAEINSKKVFDKKMNQLLNAHIKFLLICSELKNVAKNLAFDRHRKSDKITK